MMQNLFFSISAALMLVRDRNRESMIIITRKTAVFISLFSPNIYCYFIIFYCPISVSFFLYINAPSTHII